MCTSEGRERAKGRGVKLGRKPKLTDHQRREAIKRCVRQAEDGVADDGVACGFASEVRCSACAASWPRRRPAPTVPTRFVTASVDCTGPLHFTIDVIRKTIT